MQGFFVHVSDGTGIFPVTGTLGLDNNVRITDLTHALVKSEEKGPATLLRLEARFGEVNASGDPMVIYFDEKGGTGFDPEIDALKLMNTDNSVPNLYSLGTDGKKLSINALPEISATLYQVPLGLSTKIDGYVVFRILDAGEDLSGYEIIALRPCSKH